ncbi:MAG: NAD+ synthetase, partial [Planctomycetes bacterium]|nr:NAD+ synthetase [Planctomycetota bacterium]
PDAPAAITARLLTTVYQGTVNSSGTTREAAATVAAAVGATHRCIEVDPFVAGYTAAVAQAIGRQPTWERDDLALQNIQARVRAPGVWLIANLDGKLLLATSNRSEAAVGYATMDGDTCGGLSPIAGIDKAFLRRWLVWLEERGPAGLGPIPALGCVNRQASTPELRPASAGQQSEDDLMPFPVLDRIERLAIRDKLPPKDILPRLADEFPQHPRPRLLAWVERFTTLWCRNQWKRERLAPAFHLDDENLDPRSWCRFPILSGGFRRELAEMRAERA